MGSDDITYKCCQEDCPTPDVTRLVLDACSDEGGPFPADSKLARHVETVAPASAVVIKCETGHECEYPCLRLLGQR